MRTFLGKVRSKEEVNPVSPGKCSLDVLAPIQLRAGKNKKPQSSLNDANICVLLKAYKDEIDPGNYRPVNLQNYNLKIITRILANRLSKHISHVIYPDQAGFILNRY